MTLRPRRESEIPADTYEIAHGAFPRGNAYMRLRDEVGAVFDDEQFADLYQAQGQEATSPAILAWVTVLQFKEGWSDREAADAVRGRIDVKYLLNLPLRNAGFHHSALGEFRERLLAGGAEERLLDRILQVCRAHSFVKRGGGQRTDSTPVLAAVRDLNRLECVGETLRQALNQLAEIAPEWLQAQVPAEWYLWYGKRMEASRLAKSKQQAMEWQERIGESGRLLLEALADERTPAYLREVPAIHLLQMVWLQQYLFEGGQIRWRTKKNGLPPGAHFIQSPYDPQARFRTKRQVRWTGYMVHFSESCDEESPHIITNVETVLAATGDVDMTGHIHEHLAARDLLPAEHYVDGAYVSASHLVNSQNQHGIDLIGPASLDGSWQAKAEHGFDLPCFTIDWEAQVAHCPQGKQSYSWYQRTKNGNPVVEISFALNDCASCSVRTNCTKTKKRQLRLRPKEQHLALSAARQRQKTQQFREQYKRRAGIEGTFSQATRTFDLRRSRYTGLAKTHLQHVAVAVALNLSRLADWLDPLYRRESTRLSRFARLEPVPA